MWLDISPKMARAILSGFAPDDGRGAEFARRIAAGTWPTDDADDLIVLRHGDCSTIRCADGAHRLLGIYLSGRTVRARVAWRD